ncbi:hypothetical protein [Nocardioides fonticola]
MVQAQLFDDDAWFEEISNESRRVFETLAVASADDLFKQPADVSDETVDAKVKMAQQREEQAHGFRQRFFNTVTRTLWVALSSSVVLLALYMISEWHEVSPTVMVAYFSAVVVNVLGLAFIVARYVFHDPSTDS